jgi:hypothetical protein
MLMKLLATTMVAKRDLGFSNNSLTCLAAVRSELFKYCTSLADKEKKAVSAPAIIAVINSKISIDIINMVVLEAENAPADCNSKYVRFVSPSMAPSNGI